MHRHINCLHARVMIRYSIRLWQSDFLIPIKIESFIDQQNASTHQLPTRPCDDKVFHSSVSVCSTRVPSIQSKLIHFFSQVNTARGVKNPQAKSANSWKRFWNPSSRVIYQKNERPSYEIHPCGFGEKAIITIVERRTDWGETSHLPTWLAFPEQQTPRRRCHHDGHCLRHRTKDTSSAPQKMHTPPYTPPWRLRKGRAWHTNTTCLSAMAGKGIQHLHHLMST